MTHFNRLFPIAWCLVLTLTFSAAAEAGIQSGWKFYKGQYFKIAIPTGFVATPMGQNGDGGPANEVSMWNEKSKVQFCVFSPLWNGKAVFQKIDDRTEVRTARESRKIGDVREEHLTIEARDKSYIRFVVIRINETTNNNTTFGIRVPNMDVYEQVKPTYVQWKNTLVQWAD